MIYENETLKYEKRFEKMLEYYNSAPQKYWNSGENTDIGSGNTGITEQDFVGSSTFNGGDSAGCHAFAQMFLSYVFNTTLNAGTRKDYELLAPSNSDYWEIITDFTDFDGFEVGDMVRLEKYYSTEDIVPFFEHTGIVTEINRVNPKINSENDIVKVIEAVDKNYIINDGVFNNGWDATGSSGDYYSIYKNLLADCVYVVRPKKLSERIPDDTFATINLVSTSGEDLDKVYEIAGTNFYFLPSASEYITVGANEEAVWKTADGKYYKNGVPIPSGTTTLTLTPAVIPTVSTATFNVNVPSGESADSFSLDETSRRVRKGESYSEIYNNVALSFDTKTLPKATCNSGKYKFNGWYLNSDCSGDVINDGSEVKTSGAINLYAGWDRSAITVTLNCNGGTCSKPEIEVDSDGTYNGLVDAVPSGNYSFAGWYYEGVRVVNGDALVKSEDHTLTAKWNCSITYDLKGGSPVIDGKTVFKGEKINIPETVPALEGYHFKGWENSVTRDTVYPGTENVEITQNTDLTARWEEMSVVLRCDTGIATEEISVSFFETENGKIPAPNLTLPGGVTCTKWVIKGGDGTEYDAAAGDLLPEFKNYALIGVDPVYTTYPVTYNLDITDGSGDSSNASVATFEEKVSGEPYYIQKAIPYRNNGLNFLYWQDEAGTLYAPGDRVDTNVPLNLTAQWISGCFVVHFDNGVYEEDTYPVHSVPLAEMYPVLHNEDGSLKEDAGITLPSEVPVRPGYRFLGWRSIFWLSEELYRPGENYVLPNDIYEGFDIRVTNLVPLVAEWEPAYVTVNIHDPYNGSNILGSYTARVGERYGNSYVNGSVAEIEFPVIADRGETVHVGWCYGVEEVTEDSTVTADTEHTLNPIWYEETEYTDIANQSSEAKNAIAWCKYKGYMTGTSATAFTPGGSMSRGQAAMTLYKCVGQPAWGSNSFMDVHEDDYYNVAVSWCNDNGIMSGRSVNYFRPSDPITRAEFVTALYRFCGLLAPGKQTVDCDLSDSCLCSSYAEGQCKLARFEDISELSEWGRLPMAWAVNNGIMSGVSDIKLSPNVSLTRAQCAIILRRFFSYTDA